jgi:hypothetical protein
MYANSNANAREHRLPLFLLTFCIFSLICITIFQFVYFIDYRLRKHIYRICAASKNNSIF